MMLKLIKLEWKKNNIGKHIRDALILTGVLCLFLFALAFLGIANDPDTGVPDAAPGKIPYPPPLSCSQAWPSLCLRGLCSPSLLSARIRSKP